MTAWTHANYTIGWICALPQELKASITMLDETHPGLPQHSSDTNIYTFGNIGHHNVVIVCLPAGRKSPQEAAIVVAQMMRTFQSVKLCLMVGIGGGVPNTKNDIRLGDVVVSKPGSRSGGVVQYDSGRTTKGETDEEGQMVQRGVLNSPPTTLLSAINVMQVPEKIGKFSDRLKHIASRQAEFARPSSNLDLLFEANYNHVGGSTCDDCDRKRLFIRPDRADGDPNVHYGTIASGNQVIMHGITRDRLSEQFNALCFETEAAGLMNHFPCIVIRGISDYADSHKNDLWKPYAAAAAAAYARALLHILPETLSQTISGALTPSLTLQTTTSAKAPTISNIVIHKMFANLLRKHGRGFALYHPVPAEELQVGSLGLFDDNGRWFQIYPNIRSVEPPVQTYHHDIRPVARDTGRSEEFASESIHFVGLHSNLPLE